MNRRDADLVMRKRLLRAQSALLRHQFVGEWHQATAPLVQASHRLGQGAHWVRAHPVCTAAAIVTLLAWQPAAVLGLARRGLWLWQTWQRVRAPARRLSAS